MKKLFIITMLVSIILAGCSNDDTTKEQDLKVISLAPNITEIIIGLDASDTLVAVDTYSEFEETSDLEKIDAFNLNAEEILMLEPDIILLPDYNYTDNTKDSYQVFIDAGIKVVPISGANSIEEIYVGIDEIGKALDLEDSSNQLIDETKTKISELKKQYENYPTPTVYFETSPAPDIYTTGSASFLNEMIEIANGKNIFDDENTEYFSPSVEIIIQKNPDVIITNVSYMGDQVAEINNRSGFENVNAIKNNKVCAVDANSTSRPSQNITLGIEKIAECLHNES